MFGKRMFLGVVAGCAITVIGCVPTGDGRHIPLVPVGGGGGGGGGTVYRSAPAKPIAPPVYKVEQHGAVDINGCYSMADRFKKEGRKVTLKEIMKNPFNEGGGVLEFLCIFEGEDAESGASEFEDYRYNSPDEYAYP